MILLTAQRTTEKALCHAITDETQTLLRPARIRTEILFDKEICNMESRKTRSFSSPFFLQPSFLFVLATNYCSFNCLVAMQIQNLWSNKTEYTYIETFERQKSETTFLFIHKEAFST